MKAKKPQYKIEHTPCVVYRYDASGLVLNGFLVYQVGGGVGGCDFLLGEARTPRDARRIIREAKKVKFNAGDGGNVNSNHKPEEVSNANKS